MKFLIAVCLIFFNSFAASKPQKVSLLKNDIEKKLRIEKTINLINNTAFYKFDLHEKEGAISEKRHALIEEIVSAIKTSRSKNNKINLTLRLALLFMEEYYFNLKEDYEKFQRSISSEKKMFNPNTKSVRALNRARNILKRLLGYSNHPDADKIFYFYAILSADNNFEDEYLKYLELIIQKFPNSRLFSDACMQLGDYYFDKNKFERALFYYNKVIERKDSLLKSYSEFKKAWVFYNLGKIELAFDLFKKVTLTYKDSSNEMDRGIAKEASLDIVFTLAEIGDIKKAMAFFGLIDELYQNELINKLALLFKEKGLYDKAIFLWSNLLEKDDTYFKNPFYEIGILDSLVLSNKPKEVILRLEENLPYYFNPAFRWHIENKSKKENIKEISDEFENLIRKYSSHMHFLGQKTKRNYYYEFAKSLYKIYLNYFGSYKESDKIRFALAEIEYKDKEFDNAKNNYYLIYKNNDEYKKFSLLGLLSCLENILNKERKEKGLINISASTSNKVLALNDKDTYTETENEFIDFAEEYVNVFPKDKKSADILYEKAYLHYLRSDIKKSIETFWKLIQSFPEKTIVYSAAHLLMDIYNKKRDFEGLIEVCNKLLKIENLKNKKLRNEISDILRHSELKVVEGFEKRKEYLKAADAYMAYTTKYGYADNSLFEKALYNASINYEMASSLNNAIKTQEKHLVLFPKTKFKKNLFKNLAKNYALIANYEKAAEYYEKFARFFKNDAFSEKALKLSALYYGGIGQINKAEKIIKELMTGHPKIFEEMENELVNLYTLSGNKNSLIKYYKNALNEKNPIEFLSYTFALHELKSGSINQKTFEKVYEISQKNKRILIKSNKGRQLLAKTLFLAAEKKEPPFFSVTLRHEDKEIEKKLHLKLSLLKNLEKEYLDIVSLGESSWSIAAIYKIAFLYEEMLNFVNNSSPPSNLNPTELSHYKKEIQDIFINPIHEKLESILDRCIKFAGESLSISPWPNLCYSMAMKVSPQKYSPVRIVLLPPVETTIIFTPKNEDIKMSSVQSFYYPLFQSFLFDIPEKLLELSQKESYLSKYELVPELYNIGTSMFFYSGLKKKRSQDILAMLKKFESDEIDFSYLNALRLVEPLKAIKLIQKSIQRFPKSEALHNLLGLAYLEAGNLTAANMVWGSMLAHGLENGGIYNNLGVIHSLIQNDKIAISYFSEAVKSEIIEAHNNLGFMYLKYNYSPYADEQFNLALKQEKNNNIAQMGLFASLLQNRDFDTAREKVSELSQFKQDPYARLSVSYFLIDVEKDFETAKNVIASYIKEQPYDTNNIPLKKAYKESAKASAILAIPMLSLPEDGE